MKTYKAIALSASLIAGLSLNAHAETLTVSSDTAVQGDVITLQITLDNNTTGVAGAAFTLKYDESALEIDNQNGSDLPTSGVRSDFFPLFSAQIGDPSTVEVDSVTYDKALVVNSESDSGYELTRIAAARADNGPTGSTVIFEVDFKIKDDAAAGDYDVEIIPTSIYNESAGYTVPAGTDIDMLVGIDGTTTYTARTVSAATAGTITVTAAFVDTDGDGIDDNWEMSYTGSSDLTILDDEKDYDNDGYSDYQEYVNYMNGETIGGAEYDPMTPNEAGGTGYVEPKKPVITPILQLLLN